MTTEQNRIPLAQTLTTVQPKADNVVASMMADPQLAYEPKNTDAAWELSHRLYKSGLLPKWISSHEAAFAIMVAGKEIGLTSMQSIRSLKMVEGNIAMPAELMLARIKRSTDCMYCYLVESTDEIATYETHRRGEPKPTRVSFTITEARNADLLGKVNWKRYPAAMLRARCVSAIARAVYPECVLGIYESTSNESSPDDEMVIRSAPLAMTPPIVSQTSEDNTADEAQRFADAIRSAATKEELSEVRKALTKAVSDKRISQHQAFELRPIGNARLAELKKNDSEQTSNAVTMASMATTGGREPGSDDE